MSYIISVVAGIVNVYIILIFIRIILTWFPGASFGKPYIILCSICDPYLNWFRRFRLFPNSPISFTPLLAIGVLSIIHRILLSWGTLGRISITVVLVMILNALWSIISWILGFFVIILILRMIAFIFNSNIYSPFWRLVDFIAQPLMYNISRIFFPNRIVSYLFRIVFCIVVLLLLGTVIWFIVQIGSGLLMRLPL